jgi:hypothetical protein
MKLKPKPIVYCDMMIPPLLSKHKTQTRRVMCKNELDLSSKQSYTYGTVGQKLWVKEVYQTNFLGYPIYRADSADQCSNWIPARQMPKELSRINLVLTNVYAQQLQNITEIEAEAEGVLNTYTRKCNPDGTLVFPTARLEFINLWNCLHKPEASWEANPNVWVLEFEVPKLLKRQRLT